MHNIIIDCDPGHDDAVAILLAVRLANVLSITTVAGNTSLANTTRNALSLVELMGADIPVHSGEATALDGETRHAEHVHGETGFGGTALPEPAASVASDDAVGHLIEQSKLTPDLTLIAVGPLTNVAKAMQQDPDFAKRLHALALMGGSTDAGNVTSTAEFNIWADPEAARVVFAGDINPIVCGLNLTRQLRTDDEYTGSLREGGKAVGCFIAELYDYMHDRLEELVGARPAALHDPCAVLTITHPELFKFAEMHVDVEVSGELTRGMTVFDQRPSKLGPKPNCKVAVSVVPEEAKALIKDAVLSYR